MKKLYILATVAAHIISISAMETDIQLYREMKEERLALDLQFKEQLWGCTHNVLTKYPNIEPLINVVTHMNDIKKCDIDEDIMGKYAYDKWVKFPDPDKAKVTLLFGHLKYYAQTAYQAKECLPTFDDLHKKKSVEKVNNKLAKSLNITSADNCIEIKYELNKKRALKRFPAFWTLKRCVKRLLKNNDPGKYLGYIYSGYNNIPQEVSLESKYIETILKDEYFIQSKYIINITNFLPDFNQRIICNTHQLLKTMKLSSPALLEQLLEYKGKNQLTKRRYLLNHLIQTYDTQRATKMTPTIQQIEAYNQCKAEKGFAFPDHLSNEIYAFNEFNNLTDSIAQLNLADDQTVQKYAEILYEQSKYQRI